ncbi:MAG TPA: ATP-dependent helicase HrpB [Longimicrobiales bacterium]
MLLPIDDVLPDLLKTLRADTSAVLQAPPGAGKTTRVPPALLQESWLKGRRIVMLEPRRLAARAAASFMARSLGEAVGETVGYRIRFDTRVGPRTRIEVVTEGVLTRLLQDDPALEDYGIVIFDEFHERSIYADTGLALTLQARALLRNDLRVLVMSATLQGDPIAQLLGNAEVITSTGRSFPVETSYLERPRSGYVEPLVAQYVRRALAEHDGDILVFLPGAAEIRRTQEQLDDVASATTAVLPLYGNLTQAEQDRAIAPSPRGQRKVVLATSIAETSLTIEGVRVVVDSGLMRVPRFDVRTGMTRLDTVTVTKASAEQRCGRAGRVAPGFCYRMWTAHEQNALVPHGTPEILEADLAPLALDLAAWGTTDPNELPWLDAPPASAYAQARELLHELGAVDAAGHITGHGRRIARLPVHPRLGHMLLRAQELKCSALACDMAALLGERDIMRGAQPDPDLQLRLNALRGRHAHDVDRGAVQRVQREAEHLRKALHVHDTVTDDAMAGILLAFAYPDRIAQKREQRGRFVMRNGRGAIIDPQFNLAAADFVVAALLDGRGRDSRVFLAAALDEADIRAHFAEQIERTETVELQGEKLRTLIREQLGALVLSERQASQGNTEAIAAALIQAVRARGLDVLPWNEELRALQQRVAFMRQLDSNWPDLSDAALLATLETWLQPMLAGITSIQQIDLAAALQALLPWELRRQLDVLAPTHLEVPTGSHIRIDYSDPAAPAIAVRLQEVFGLTETPRIGGGRVPVTMQLLSPARRPVQVTRDLASFWRSGYFDVKKELKGRYPKHYWPDDPLVAEPTRGVRRKR